MTLALTEPFEQRIAETWPADKWCDSHVVLAVSGGADSVSMLRAAVTIKRQHGGRGQLFVAHLNHLLRGSGSEADAQWLQALCNKLEVPLTVGRSDVAKIAAAQGDGIEAAARSARYDFLRQTAESLGARFVAVGHTADDHVETVLHRIVRGTGIAGLTGIPFTRPLSPSVSIVRPLLKLTRPDVIQYLKAIDQDYRVDSTNFDPRYLRNRMRSHLLRTLRNDYNSDVDGAVTRLAMQAAETQQVIAAIAEQLRDQFVTVQAASTQEGASSRRVNRIQLNGVGLAEQVPLVIREVCKAAWKKACWSEQAMGFDEWQQLADFIAGKRDATALNLPGDIRVRREGSSIILRRGTLA